MCVNVGVGVALSRDGRAFGTLRDRIRSNLDESIAVQERVGRAGHRRQRDDFCAGAVQAVRAGRAHVTVGDNLMTYRDRLHPPIGDRLICLRPSLHQMGK